jgi:predicted phosphoribosyltransferase
MHSNFACQKAIDIVSEIIEEQITMFLSKIGNPQSNTNLPINYIEQKGMKSFNHRNILYEIHSHHVYKRLHMSGQDPFEASYNIILKMQNKYEYFVVCVNGTATGVTRKAAIVAARRAAERETNKYNIGPVKY